MQQELEAVRSRAAALGGASEECGELKACLASARAAAAAAKQAAQQQEFQLQAQVSYRNTSPSKTKRKNNKNSFVWQGLHLPLQLPESPAFQFRWMQIISAKYGGGT